MSKNLCLKLFNKIKTMLISTLIWKPMKISIIRTILPDRQLTWPTTYLGPDWRFLISLMRGSQLPLISKPLSLFRLQGCFKISRASLIFRFWCCSSLAMIDALSKQMWCLVFEECSAKAEVRVLPFLMSAPCSFSLVWRERPVSPI